ncbi:unnamed protein product [Cunninghamella blakesleeana]
MSYYHQNMYGYYSGYPSSPQSFYDMYKQPVNYRQYHPPHLNYMPYYNYYYEPNVLNRLINRARFGTGSYFGNPYARTRVSFDPLSGKRIWPEDNYVSSVKDLWKTSDPYT